MFKVYPKTNCMLEGLDKFKKIVNDYKGIEVQFFHENGKMNPFRFEGAIKKIYDAMPTLEEIVVHPPLCNYDLELVLLKDKNIILDQLKKLVEISQELSINISIIYHTTIIYDNMKEVLVKPINEMLKIVEGSNVTIMLENLYMIEERNMSVLNFVSEFNHPNLKVCFDICHAYCQVHIYKADNFEYLDEYLDKGLCQRFVKQVHFSYTRDNDGYIRKNETHGACHDSIESLKYDLEVLKRYGMLDTTMVVEVGEDDGNYADRKNQLKDIKMIYEFMGKDYYNEDGQEDNSMMEDTTIDLIRE